MSIQFDPATTIEVENLIRQLGAISTGFTRNPAPAAMQARLYRQHRGKWQLVVTGNGSTIEVNGIVGKRAARDMCKARGWTPWNF